jgi:hypothetical protein
MTEQRDEMADMAKGNRPIHDDGAFYRAWCSLPMPITEGQTITRDDIILYQTKMIAHQNLLMAGINYSLELLVSGLAALGTNETSPKEVLANYPRLLECEKMLRGISDNAPGGMGRIGMPTWEDVRRALEPIR